MDFEVIGVLSRIRSKIKVSGGVTGRREIVLRILLPLGGQIPAFLNAEVIVFSVKLTRQASRNKGQKERFVINTTPRPFIKNLFTLSEYSVERGLK